MQQKRRAEHCLDGECPGQSCTFHTWKRQKRYKNLAPENAAFSLAESYRLLLMEKSDQQTKEKPKAKLVKAGTFIRSTRMSEDVSPKAAAIERLANFLRLLAHLNTAPWANHTFTTNERIVRRLTAAHLPIIVGKKLAEKFRAQLIAFLDTGNCVKDARNTVWITNRQQGKTTTLSKFIAALAIFSSEGGLIATIYSTGLDRAVELVKGAKQYINWMKTKDGRMEAHSRLVYARDNERSFTLKTNDGTLNEIAARPRNVDSCRGDAPKAAFFDEAAFMSSNFWYQFAYPLLQVKNRIFTCTTTPPPQDNYFAEFAKNVKKRNEQGDNFFFLINHALACENCIEANEHDNCTHQLHLIPPWKSLLRMTHMAALVPAGKQKDFQAEVYGVCHKTDGYYFDHDLTVAMVERRPSSKPKIKENIVYVAIDPASHQKSEMAFVATALAAETGQTIILGLANVKVGRFEAFHVQHAVALFSQRLLAATAYMKGIRTFIPIVECNNNEIVAMSIKTAFEEAINSIGTAQTALPFTAKHFKKNITPGLGVWTTDQNKLAGVQELQTLLMEGRILLAQNLVTITRTCIENKNSDTPNPRTAVNTLVEQLTRIKDDEKGRISGKTRHGDEDDIAIALIFGIYWSTALRHVY